MNSVHLYGPVFETVQQAHDVPFGSTFEVHTETKLFSMQHNIKVLNTIPYWCSDQLLISSCTEHTDTRYTKYKKEVAQMLEIARSYLVKAKGSSQDKPEASETPTSTLS
ncbi:hypothetical protein GW17_00020917 [Ensete ventricosum]|nr:hypothetical protein GW17_00020917 [Ensete ventricosum]